MKFPNSMQIDKGSELVPGALVAVWGDLAGYYRAPNGDVWSYGVTGEWINRGPLTREIFENRLRGTWLEAVA